LAIKHVCHSSTIHLPHTKSESFTFVIVNFKYRHPFETIQDELHVDNLSITTLHHKNGVIRIFNMSNPFRNQIVHHPSNVPLSGALDMRVDRVSATKLKMIGDRGSLCLSP
jgi:hypothetical protein